MNENLTIPETWQPPDWHPDWRDAAAELELLRRFAIAFRAELQDCPLSLKILEPGYMYLELVPRNGIRIEVYVPGRATSDCDDVKLYLFAGESENEIEVTSVVSGVAVAVSFARANSEPHE